MNLYMPRGIFLAYGFMLMAALAPNPAKAADMLPNLPVKSLSGTKLTLPTDLGNSDFGLLSNT